jgi:hypothetical protein
MGREFAFGFFSLAAALIALLLGAVLLFVSYDFAIDEKSFWHPATHEVGFALIVAVVIWVTFEVFSQSAAERRWHSRMEDIAQSVFMGVFRRRLPEELIMEVSELIFDNVFIRDRIDIIFTITDHEYRDRQGEAQRFVCLNALSTIIQRNVNLKHSPLKVTLGLPNPLIDEMKPFCKVNSCSVKINGKKVALQLDKAEKGFRLELANDQKFSAMYDAGEVRVPPNAKVEISWDYTMAKEEEDTEVFQTMMPLRELNLTVIDTDPQCRIVRARSIHRTELQSRTSLAVQGTHSYSIDNYLLPHQGFSIWWKKRPPAMKKLPAPAKPVDGQGVDKGAAGAV